ncbi:MAG: hypothetical protein V3U99_05450, partial [Alphaproteobacteria bacterium]
RRGMPRPLSHTPIPLRVHPVTITPDGEVMVDPDTAISRDGFSPDHVVAPEPGAHLASEAREGA